MKQFLLVVALLLPLMTNAQALFSIDDTNNKTPGKLLKEAGTYKLVGYGFYAGAIGVLTLGDFEDEDTKVMVGGIVGAFGLICHIVGDAKISQAGTIMMRESKKGKDDVSLKLKPTKQGVGLALSF